MIIGIDMGHTINGANYGSVGILKESEETRSLGNRVINYLKALGHKIVNCSIDQASSNNASLAGRVSKANAQHLDLFVSIHFNKSVKSNAYGSEIFTYNANKLPQAISILENLNKLGFTSATKDKLSRGIKNGAGLYVIKNTKSKAMLIEICFIDYKRDVDLYKSNIDNIAKIIAEGITGQKIQTRIFKADKNSLIATSMQGHIKILQQMYGLTQNGIVTEELINKLPEFNGGESRGTATILQQILMLKGFLSKDTDYPPIGKSVRDATERLKKSTGLPLGGAIANKDVWHKLLEY